MTAARRKLTQSDIARFRRIDAARKARKTEANDNGIIKSSYVDTTLTPAMLAACVEAAGFVS